MQFFWQNNSPKDKKAIDDNLYSKMDKLRYTGVQ